MPRQDGGEVVTGTDETSEFVERKRALLAALLEVPDSRPVEMGPALFRLGERAGLTRREVEQVVPALFYQSLVHRNQLDDTISVSYLGRQWLGGAAHAKEGAEPYRIFISHNHEDEEVALKLKEFLVNLFTDRVDVFISGDPRSNLAGNDLITTIISSIRHCDLMLILCTPESVLRPWVNFEAGAGEASTAEMEAKRIVPVCFGGLAGGSLPVLLSHRQAIDHADEGKFRGHFEVLVRTIAERTGTGVTGANILDSPFAFLLRKADSRQGADGSRDGA